MHGTQHSHFVRSEEFRALGMTCCLLLCSLWDNFLCSSLLPTILLRNVANRHLALEGPLFDSF